MYFVDIHVQLLHYQTYHYAYMLLAIGCLLMFSLLRRERVIRCLTLGGVAYL